MNPLIINSNWGLGDNIFQRPFVRAAAASSTVYMDTPWPELYADLPIKFIRNPKREGRLRTQTKNVKRQPEWFWEPRPKVAQEISLSYGHAILQGRSIVRAIERNLPLKGAPFRFDLPELGGHRFEHSTRPIAIVRPVTLRREWFNEARNPRPEYLKRIADRLMDTHHVVSIADLRIAEEWLVDPVPPAHERLHNGELDVRELLAIVRDADAIIGGVGWIVPASIALKTDCFVILGGMGSHNSPAMITDPRMDLSRLGFATPDRFCACSNMRHRCDKTISNLDAQFEKWLDQLGAT